MIFPIIVWLTSFALFAEIVRFLWNGDQRNMIKYQGYIGFIAASAITMYFYVNMM